MCRLFPLRESSKIKVFTRERTGEPNCRRQFGLHIRISSFTMKNKQPIHLDGLFVFVAEMKRFELLRSL